MNFNTLTPTAKLLKKLQNYSDGQTVTSGDVPCIAIICSGEIIESKKLVENVCGSIKSNGASVFNYNVPCFGSFNKINPMTAKFAESFRRLAAQNAEAIIKSNMIDGAVIVTDCDVTAAGLVYGCLRANCPALVLPLGAVNISTYNSGKNILGIAGDVTSGELTSAQSEEIIKSAAAPKEHSSLFALLENLGFCAEGASLNNRGSGSQLRAAAKTGEKIVSMAKDLVTPRKLLNKNAYQSAVEFCLKNGHSISALEHIKKLMIAADVKIDHEYVGSAALKMSPSPRTVLVKGTACDKGGYVQYGEGTPMSFNGKAWVYQSLEDADNALLGGKIPADSIVVVQNCADTDVSALAYAVEGMGRTKNIAIVTDGVCNKTDVLTVTVCTPNSLANEEFANIQNGDVLDIDISRGRFNTSILSKDLKSRIKRNTVKKQVMYF